MNIGNIYKAMLKVLKISYGGGNALIWISNHCKG